MVRSLTKGWRLALEKTLTATERSSRQPRYTAPYRPRPISYRRESKRERERGEKRKTEVKVTERTSNIMECTVLEVVKNMFAVTESFQSEHQTPSASATAELQLL